MIWKQTYTGRAVDMLGPRPEDIALADVAHALALINRYDGHTRVPISVALHSILGATALMLESSGTRLATLFLLHDAHEAYVGDIGTPVQHALGYTSFGCIVALSTIRHRFDFAIHAAAGVALPTLMERSAVKAMDLRLLRAERDALMGPKPMAWDSAVEAAAPLPSLSPEDFDQGDWRAVENRYLALAGGLCPGWAEGAP